MNRWALGSPWATMSQIFPCSDSTWQSTAVVLVTHGNAGLDMVQAAESFLQLSIPRLVSIGVEPKDSPSDVDHKIDLALQKLRVLDPKQVLFLVDLVGSTPARLCCGHCDEKGHVVTGVNLPMLLKLATTDRSKSAVVLAKELVTTGARSIHQE